MAKLIVVGGPTASGKTALAIALANKLGAEIVNADSRQFYRGMDIGTAKPTREEQQQAKHHFIDIKNPGENYSAGAFARDCLAFLHDYFQQKEHALMVGGSGLYINAVTHGLAPLPAVFPEIRNRWNETFATEGIHALQEALAKADPAYFATVDRQNPQRLIRALEVFESTGTPYSALRKSHPDKRGFEVTGVWLNPERDVLYRHINQRVGSMMDAGLRDEVRKLLPFKNCNAMQTVGYKEMCEHLEGKISLDEAIEKTKQHTRNYAKRQTTWFKKQAHLAPLAECTVEAAWRQLNL